MVSVKDIAAFLLLRAGPMTAMKLQKLVYYCQAWWSVRTDTRLFPETIYAWAYGPVVYDLFELHRGCYAVSRLSEGDAEALSSEVTEFLGQVLEHYGVMDGRKLSELTHQEDPWRYARTGLQDGARGSAEIPWESMRAYYSRQPWPSSLKIP